MVQIPLGSATTSHMFRAAIHRLKASVAALAKQYGVNPNTVRKWRKRTSVEDTPMEPKTPRSNVLSPVAEAAWVAVHQHTLLPLDDGQAALFSKNRTLSAVVLDGCALLSMAQSEKLYAFREIRHSKWKLSMPCK